LRLINFDQTAEIFGLVPEERDETDSDFETPFLIHIAPVATVTQAYQALTDLQRIP
jgi:hypothetical protein